MATAKVSSSLKALVQAATRFWPESASRSYPREVIDLLVFHRLHLAMDHEAARRSFHLLKTEFVDWNEVRVSSFREIQEPLAGVGRCAEGTTLEMAVFVKELLDFVYRETHRVCLEHIVEKNLSEIRRYLQQVRGLDPVTVEVLLLVRKDHPVVPLSRPMEALVERLRVLPKSLSRDARQKRLYELVGGPRALQVHHLLLQHAHVCESEDSAKLCRTCRLGLPSGRRATRRVTAAGHQKTAQRALRLSARSAAKRRLRSSR